MTLNAISMMLWNFGEPFIGPDLAQKIARVIVENKYTKDIFEINGDAIVIDNDHEWKIVFKNTDRTDKSMPFATNDLEVHIKKSNGEIVRMP